MKANYHTHTERCRHAQGTEEDYIKSAIDGHLAVLGFSDHAPFPDHDFGLRMPYSELEDYLQTIDTLAEKYSAAIILHKGLEIEYLPEYMNYYEYLLQEEKLDYLLLGEHFYRDSSGCMFNITQAQSTDTYVAYARAVADAIKTGYFKIIGHPDIFMMNRFAWDANCEKATEIIVDAALLTGAILEFNANGIRRGIYEYPDGQRCMYPHKAFWKSVSKARIPVVIGSDCHNFSQVWDESVEQAYIRLQELGLTPLETIESV